MDETVHRYLHYEVVDYGACMDLSQWGKRGMGRKFGIDRIDRYVVTSFSTGRDRVSGRPFAPGTQFKPFQNFDDGVGPPSTGWPNVGCGKPWYRGASAYVDEGARFFDLPGRCPTVPWAQRTVQCMQDEPGGECDEPDGTSACTWHVEHAGFVELDALIGVTGELQQWCRDGGKEYKHSSDRGERTCFWDGREDVQRVRERVARVDELFRSKYPGLEGDAALRAPVCQ